MNDASTEAAATKYGLLCIVLFYPSPPEPLTEPNVVCLSDIPDCATS